MRIAILADIHANLAALRAVLDHAEARRPVDRLWVLGDTVGYGPQPNECIALLRRYPQDAIIGNHDLAALGRHDTAAFNPWAAAATAWTAAALDDDARAYLESLPEVVTAGQWTLVHGTLRDPVVEYLYSTSAAFAHLTRQPTPFGAVGHTHVPTIGYVQAGSEEPASLHRPGDGDMLALDYASQVVINPGGVGQPRDGDERTAYALYDDEASALTFHRVTYDIAATQGAMVTAGLPRPLIDRLSFGR